MVKYLRLDNDEIVVYDDSRICGKYDGEGYEYPEEYVRCWSTHYKEYAIKILNDKEIDVVHYEWSDYEEKMIRYQFILGIVKQADSLDKLCDEFVLIEKNSKPRIFETLKGATNNKIYDDEEIYGAIWTEDGLIYRAKMNYSGRLVML